MTVLPQQSLYDVARQENVSVQALAQVNGLSEPYQIYIGQRLAVPTGAYEVATYSGPAAPRTLGGQPRPVITGAQPSGTVAATPLPSGPVSGGTVASAPANQPAATQGQSVGEPGLYGAVDVAALPESVGATPAPAAGENLPWQDGQAAVGQAPFGEPPAPGTVEVLEAQVEPEIVEPANAPRASGEQVASLPVPGVSDVSPSDDVAPASFPVPVHRPDHGATESQKVAVATPEPVPVPDLPEEGVENVVMIDPPVTVEAPVETPVPASISELPPLGERAFEWPVTGDVISTFGAGLGEGINDGINISATKGTEILASQDGFVVYAGNELAGFGNLILIRHADNWVTGYAHADQMLVGKDQFVRMGEVIGTVGTTGSVSEPQLHFEIRQGTDAVDPANHMVPLVN
ncbi:MAG: peptidoglycan DD-metalloendopeptidase family protein [Pseudomonadota bacterium]